jgi:chromosome segregation ATPase
MRGLSIAEQEYVRKYSTKETWKHSSQLAEETGAAFTSIENFRKQNNLCTKRVIGLQENIIHLEHERERLWIIIEDMKRKEKTLQDEYNEIKNDITKYSSGYDYLEHQKLSKEIAELKKLKEDARISAWKKLLELEQFERQQKYNVYPKEEEWKTEIEKEIKSVDNSAVRLILESLLNEIDNYCNGAQVAKGIRNCKSECFCKPMDQGTVITAIRIIKRIKEYRRTYPSEFANWDYNSLDSNSKSSYPRERPW